MTVPQPVMSLAIMAKAREATANFSKALNRFTKEDPTFKASTLPSHLSEGLSLSHPCLLWRLSTRKSKSVGKVSVNSCNLGSQASN